MACCLSPSCCPGRNARRPAIKSAGRTSTGVVRSRKKAATPSTAAEPPTPQTSTVVPDMVDRLRRRLCQDDGNDVTQRGSPCRCCRRCLGEDDGPPVTGDEPRPSPVHPDPTTASPVAGETPGTTETDADFMTLFFRNCERIVFDNAAAIHGMLTGPASVEEEQRDSADWTSNRTEPSSSANTAEQRRHFSGDDDNVAFNSRSELTEDAATSASCGRTEGSVERLIAPANSPVSAGSLLTSSLSDDALLTTCVCSASTRAAYDDGQFVRRRPSVSGQSPAAVNALSSTTDRYKNSWRRRRRRVIVRTSTDDNDNGYREVVVNRKSAGMTSFPVGLGSRPPCLGQECSPIRSTPCGAGRETGSSAATAGTTSGGPTRRVLPPGRVDQGRVAAFCRRKRRGSGPPPRLPMPHTDAPSPAVVQQSYRKVNTWLRHHTALPEVKNDVISPVSGHQSTPEYQLKRKLIRGEADSGAKRRVTDSDSCSLPSGTFTSDDEEDEVDDNDENRADGTTTAAQIPDFPVSPVFKARPRQPMTSPRREKRSPLADVACSRRRRSNAENVARTCEWGDVSSGALGDRSSSLATSGDLAPCRRQGSSRTATKTRSASRKNAVERRREVVRRVTRMARRLHRVAAAEVVCSVHVQTLAVL